MRQIQGWPSEEVLDSLLNVIDGEKQVGQAGMRALPDYMMRAVGVPIEYGARTLGSFVAPIYGFCVGGFMGAAFASEMYATMPPTYYGKLKKEFTLSGEYLTLLRELKPMLKNSQSVIDRKQLQDDIATGELLSFGQEHSFTPRKLEQIDDQIKTDNTLRQFFISNLQVWNVLSDKDYLSPLYDEELNQRLSKIIQLSLHYLDRGSDTTKAQEN